MTTVAKITERFGFVLPSVYVAAERRGLLANDQGLVFGDFEWLSLEAMAAFEPLKFQKKIVPFAVSGRGDLFGWCPVPDSADQWWVAFFARDVNEAAWYAPNFQGFVVRMMFEECSGSWLEEEMSLEELRVVFQRNLNLAGFLLSDAVQAILREILWRPFFFDANAEQHALMGGDTARELISEHLVFPRLDEIFTHDNES